MRTMKVAIYSESPADEAALRILVNALLETATEPICLPWLKSRGWPSVKENLGKVVQHLYYQTDAQGLVVVVDSDTSPLPTHPPQQPADAEDKSRICQLQRLVDLTQSQLASVPKRAALKTAFGLAVPTIEAWYRCSLDPHVNEATWVRALQSSEYPYDAKRLKRDVYGTDRPSLELERSVATEQAQRLVNEQKLGLLEKLFPIGFGVLARDLRGW